MRYDWSDGTTRRHARCFDRDTGEELSPVFSVDEEAGTVCRPVIGRDGRWRIDPNSREVVEATERRRVRILWLETEEEAEAREALIQQYVEELRAARQAVSQA